MESLSGVSLRTVETVDEASEFIRWLGGRRPVLGLDTETKGLKPFSHDQFVRLVQFGDAMTGWTISATKWRGLIDTALEKYDQPIALHNAPFDINALQHDGYPLPPQHLIHDSMLQAVLINPWRRNGLKELSEATYGPAATIGQRMLKRAMDEGGWTWESIPESVPAYSNYSSMDTVLTARLFEKQDSEFTGKFREAYEVELAYQEIARRWSYRGIRVDTAYSEKLSAQWALELVGLKATLEAFGIPNPGSNKQVEVCLREAGWEPDEFTDSGQARLDKKVFAQLMNETYTSVTREIVEVLIEYKQKTKWRQTYLQTFLREADENGFVHPGIRTLRAVTGRSSITNPALQTLPKGDPTIRRAIVSLRDSDRIYCCDYDSQELRLLAHFANEEGMAQTIREGRDLHRFVASQAFNVKEENVTKEQRAIAKTTAYCLVYGGGPKKITQTAGITRAEADSFVGRFDQVFPGVKGFMREQEAIGADTLAKEGRPYIRTFGGRRVSTAADTLYRLPNYKIQGSAADLLKQKVIGLDQAGLADYVVVPVHDELILSIPEDQPEIANEIHLALEDHTNFNVPLTTGLKGPFSSWGEAYL